MSTDNTSKKNSGSRKGKRAPLAFEFDEVEKHYGDVIAVGPVSFTVETGQAVALVGHNGSGKSTLLSLAAGVADVSEGSVKIAGAEAGTSAARAALSYIPDHPVLYDDLSLWEHVEYLSHLHGSTPEAHDAKGLIERLGLASRVDDLPSTFSRGLRQKSAIVVGLCRPFATLVIDEPFSGLDRTGREALLELIAEIRDERGSVLVATHDPQMLGVFDRAVMLEQGEVVFDGPADDLKI